MQFESYQHIAKKFANYEKYGIKDKLSYLAIGLAGESGEVANKIKKVLRNDIEISEIKGNVAKELGDVLWYLSELGALLGYDLDEIARININKLNERYRNGTIQGDGDGSRI